MVHETVAAKGWAVHLILPDDHIPTGSFLLVQHASQVFCHHKDVIVLFLGCLNDVGELSHADVACHVLARGYNRQQEQNNQCLSHLVDLYMIFKHKSMRVDNVV